MIGEFLEDIRTCIFNYSTEKGLNIDPLKRFYGIYDDEKLSYFLLGISLNGLIASEDGIISDVDVIEWFSSQITYCAHYEEEE